jgi:hypothetical protein
MRSRPRRKGDQLIEFVAVEVFVFIKQTFPSPRLVNSATAGLKERGEAVGRSALSRIQILVSGNSAKSLASLSR